MCWCRQIDIDIIANVFSIIENLTITRIEQKGIAATPGLMVSLYTLRYSIKSKDGSALASRFQLFSPDRFMTPLCLFTKISVAVVLMRSSSTLVWGITAEDYCLNQENIVKLSGISEKA